jgi:hypothetical protein
MRIDLGGDPAALDRRENITPHVANDLPTLLQGLHAHVFNLDPRNRMLPFITGLITALNSRSTCDATTLLKLRELRLPTPPTSSLFERCYCFFSSSATHPPAVAAVMQQLQPYFKKAEEVVNAQIAQALASRAVMGRF